MDRFDILPILKDANFCSFDLLHKTLVDAVRRHDESLSSHVYLHQYFDNPLKPTKNSSMAKATQSPAVVGPASAGPPGASPGAAAVATPSRERETAFGPLIVSLKVGAEEGSNLVVFKIAGNTIRVSVNSTGQASIQTCNKFDAGACSRTNCVRLHGNRDRKSLMYCISPSTELSCAYGGLRFVGVWGAFRGFMWCSGGGCFCGQHAYHPSFAS